MLFISLGLNSQNLVEKIAFQSANPFSFHDVITDLENQEKQELYGNLVIPYDSLNPKNISIARRPICSNEFETFNAIELARSIIVLST